MNPYRENAHGLNSGIVELVNTICSAVASEFTRPNSDELSIGDKARLMTGGSLYGKIDDVWEKLSLSRAQRKLIKLKFKEVGPLVDHAEEERVARIVLSTIESAKTEESK